MTATEERRETRESCIAQRVSWIVAAIVVVWTVAHLGCHSDEDTELGLMPPVETRPAR